MHCLRREAKTVMFLCGVNPKRRTDMAGCEHRCRLFDDLVGLFSLQRHPLMQNGFYVETVFQEVGQKLSATDGTIGLVAIGNGVFTDGYRIFNHVFGSHSLFFFLGLFVSRFSMCDLRGGGSIVSHLLMP